MLGKTNFKPLHIDLDLYIPGNVIYSNDNELNTVNSQSGITSTIAGVTVMSIQMDMAGMPGLIGSKSS